MKKIQYILLVCLGAIAAVSCGDDNHREPGRIYAPDMTYSQAFDFYNGTERIEEAGGQFNKLPAKGSIAREQSLPTHIGEFDTTEAKAMTNPYTFYAKDLEEGNRLYLIHCAICHGEKLDGNGPLYTSGKFIAMPANLNGPNYINMPSGKMFHALVYGKNAMGSYASQLKVKQRWQVIAYIRSVQAENGGTMGSLITAGDSPAKDVVAEVVTPDASQSEGKMETAPKDAH